LIVAAEPTGGIANKVTGDIDRVIGRIEVDKIAGLG
jgi:hypothetical protein